MATLTFFGAVTGVTGSAYLLEKRMPAFFSIAGYTRAGERMRQPILNLSLLIPGHWTVSCCPMPTLIIPVAYPS